MFASRLWNGIETRPNYGWTNPKTSSKFSHEFVFVSNVGSFDKSDRLPFAHRGYTAEFVYIVKYKALIYLYVQRE